MLNVLLLERAEVLQKLPSCRDVVAASLKLPEAILLLGDMSLSLGNMLLRFREMTKVHSAISYPRIF
jgi:hypothetical protein